MARHIRRTAGGQEYRFYTDDAVPSFPTVRAYAEAPLSVRAAAGGVDVMAATLGLNAAATRASRPDAQTVVAAARSGMSHTDAMAAAEADLRRARAYASPAPSAVMTQTEAGERVHGLVRAYQDAHPGTPYAPARGAVLDADPDLKCVYTGTMPDPAPPAPLSPAAKPLARDLVAARVESYLLDHPKTSYVDAKAAVFEADPVLKDQYARS